MSFHGQTHIVQQVWIASIAVTWIIRQMRIQHKSEGFEIIKKKTEKK